MEQPAPSPDRPAEEHFVYIYYDEGKSNRARYVGYGRLADRASVHLVATHNPALEQFLADRRYRIVIAGPYGSETVGRAVETALISALEPDLNACSGPAAWRFRPLGVPLQYADRQTLPELGLEDFLTSQGATPSPVLFVIVTGRFLDDDGRIGYDPANPPNNDDVRIRVDRWWQIGNLVPAWVQTPSASPGLLVGVYGSPGRQTVIASLKVDQFGWASANRRSDNQGRVQVPLAAPADLDAFALRGRRIGRAAGLGFGSFSMESFAILEPEGTLRFGRGKRT